MNQYEFSNFVFSFGKLRDGSLTYFQVFVTLYLQIAENFHQAHFSLTTSLE